jgi:hypothetical protein
LRFSNVRGPASDQKIAEKEKEANMAEPQKEEAQSGDPDFSS